jgi:flagellar hook-associated protein 3 FlgL
MRISTIQAFNNGVQGLQRNYANATRTQEQISTGNRILTPADDPVASVRLLQLEQQQNVLTQYNNNLTAAKNSLTQEEVTLTSVNTVLQRVRELAVQAGNGALSQADRSSIGSELRERENELLTLMNTRNARGEFLFSGFQGKSQPFVREADGSYSYRGDEGQRKLQIASSLNLAISDNGKKVFEDVRNAGRINTSVLSSPTGSTLRASSPVVTDEVAFAGTPGFPATGIEIVFRDAPDQRSYDAYAYPWDGVAAPLPGGSGQLDDKPEQSDNFLFKGVSFKFDGVSVGGERVAVVPQSAGVMVSSASASAQDLRTVITDPFAFATNFPAGSANLSIANGAVAPNLNFTLNTTPPTGLDFSSDPTSYPLLLSTANGLSIRFDNPPSAGDSFVLSPDVSEEKQGILNTIAALRAVLENEPDTPIGNLNTRDAVAVALINLDNGMESVSRSQGEIGARLNIIESTQADNEDVSLLNKGVQADLRELDYAEALSRLSFQTIILEAAQQSYVKISSLNLFNQLR